MISDAPFPEVAGVILAGGASTRFGTNKALALLAGKPLVAHIAAKLSPLFAERLLVTNTPETYRFLGWPMTGDRLRNAGPLAGIEAALHGIHSPRALIVGCDMPGIDPRLLSFLARSSPDWDVVLPWLAQGPEPLCAIYHRRALPIIETALRRGERKIGMVLSQLKTKRLGPAELLAFLPDLSSFHNINRPEDFAILLAKEGKKPPPGP